VLWKPLYIRQKPVRTYLLGMLTYMNDFMHPYWTAVNSFTTARKEKLAKAQPLESVRDYLELVQFNLQVAERGFTGSLKGMDDYYRRETAKASMAWLNSFFDRNEDNLHGLCAPAGQTDGSAGLRIPPGHQGD